MYEWYSNEEEEGILCRMNHFNNRSNLITLMDFIVVPASEIHLLLAQRAEGASRERVVA